MSDTVIKPEDSGDYEEGPDGIPRGNSKAYTQKDYWDRRFVTEEHHEWLASYKSFGHLIAELIPDKKARILLVGCGNSTLAADMVDDGYTNIISTDYSEPVINRMKAKYGESHPSIVWEVQDMTKLTSADRSFDVVFDKAAMDAVLAHGADVWDPPEHLLSIADAICAETVRVLVDGGLYLQLTFSQPHFRKRYLLQSQETRWSDFKKYDVDVGFGYFLFALRKVGGT